MSKIFIQRLNVEQTVTFELDSGLEVTAVLIVSAHVEDSGIGSFECHGVTGNDVRLGWEIDDIQILSADIYCHDLCDFARLQTTSHALLRNIIEPRIEITQDPRGYEYED
jgi:hypothetical protein